MAKKSLPPGFRFHPTDVELIMYYLKRKVKGKKIHAEPIAEVNIYKFSPWDLPDKSCMRSNDLKWFFFCPRERKYASGARVKRATENGYWKITGKDRSINYYDKSVGTVKTLIFHLGHAPHGERTDWVIHEYKILDDQLAAAGVQDTYVLCKVFKKNGLGPNNGAQYGAPFKEEDWSDDETDIAQHSATPLLTPGGPPFPRLLSEKQNFAHNSLFEPGSTSGISTIEGGPSRLAGPITGEVVLDDDEIDRLLSMYRDEGMLPHNENGNHKNDELNDQREITVVPFMDGNDIYNNLQDLDNSAPMNEFGFDFSGTETILQDDYNSLNNNILLQEDDNRGGGYIELNDLLPPLDYQQPPQFVPNNQLYNMFEFYSHGFSSSESQLPVLANKGPDDVLQMVNNNQSYYNYYQNAAEFDLGISNTAGNDIDSLFNQDNDTGTLESLCVAQHFSFSTTCDGSSIHIIIKAEVIIRPAYGEFTNEALSVMMEAVEPVLVQAFFHFVHFKISHLFY